jgi:hypothetical protein
MNILSAIFNSISGNAAGGTIKPAGVVRDDDGWYYEESQNFSSSQNTIRIDQIRPGRWDLFMGHCMVVGLNAPARSDGVRRFFNGAYRWLRFVPDVKPASGEALTKVVGSYRDTSGRKHEVHLGFLKRELTEDLDCHDVTKLWGKIRLIRFPAPGRDSKYLIRFDLMQQMDASS